MELTEAIETGVILVNDNRELIYNGLCNECEYSERRAYPASSNMCMNKECEWYGGFHADHSLNRYVNGCWAFKKKIIVKAK